MPDIKSIVSTVVSEFSLLLQDGEHPSYEYRTEIVCKGESEPVFIQLLLEGDGLSVWCAGAGLAEGNKDLENEIYDTVRPLPIVRQTIKDINDRADNRG